MFAALEKLSDEELVRMLAGARIPRDGGQIARSTVVYGDLRLADRVAAPRLEWTKSLGHLDGQEIRSMKQ